MKRHTWWALLAALLVPLTACAAPATIQPLTAATIPALLAPPAHGERIVMLWALKCRYCEPNMRELAKLQRTHPHEVQLVLVSTDSIKRHAAIHARLVATGIAGYPAYAYTAPTPTRLNYLIDPGWGGEMPRTLVIRTDGTRMAMSGLLTPAQLRRLSP